MITKPEVSTGLALQVAKVYGEKPPPRHIIHCASPSAALLTRKITCELVRDAAVLPRMPSHNPNDLLELSKSWHLPPVVRFLISTYWKHSPQNVRAEVEAMVRRFVQNSFKDYSQKLLSSVADSVWQTLQAVLGDPDLCGLEACVGRELCLYGNIFPDQPDRPTDSRFHEHVIDFGGTFGRDTCVAMHRLVRTYKPCEGAMIRADASGNADPSDTVDVAAGLFLPHEQFCWVGEAPQKLLLDPERPQTVTLRYEDGSEARAETDKTVGGSLLTRAQHEIVSAILLEPGEEQRKSIKKYGELRFLKLLGGRAVHSDDYGTLWKTPNPIGFIPANEWPNVFPGPRPQQCEGFAFVQVVNSTPEADASFKDYFLRVPYTVRSAKEAVAWTFVKEVREYQPQIET